MVHHRQQRQRRRNNAVGGPGTVGAALSSLLLLLAMLGAQSSLLLGDGSGNRSHALVAASTGAATLPSARRKAAAALAASAASSTTRTRRTRGDVSNGVPVTPSLRDATDSRYHRHKRRILQKRNLQNENMDAKKTQRPSEEPTQSPTLYPTVSPAPSASPTDSQAPSVSPSSEPSTSPSAMPSDVPTAVPSSMPSSSPTVSHAPTTSPQPTSVEFTKSQTLRDDANTNVTSYETLYSCSTSDLPNDKYEYPLISNEMSFQYRAVVHEQVFDPSSETVQALVGDMEVQIQKNLAWHYLNCDYQSDFVYQGFYVHSISSDVPDEADKDECDADGTSTSSNSTTGTSSNGDKEETLDGATHCLTVTARYKLQLVLYPERRRTLQESSDTSSSSSSSSSSQQWGMDGRVVKDVGTFLTQLLQDEQTWQDLPAIKSTQFRGFVNSAAEGGGGDGTEEGGTSGNEDSTAATPNSSSSQGSNYLAVLPWIAIVLAVLVLGAALFLVLRHRKKNRLNSDSDKVLPSGQFNEQTHLEDSYSDAANNTNPTDGQRPAAFDFGDESTAGYDDVNHRRRGMMATNLPDDSTIRSDLGYSIEPMDYSNIGPTSSFDSEWTDANRSLFNLDKVETTAGEEDPSLPTEEPLPQQDTAAAPVSAPPNTEEEVGESTPRSSARLINAGLAMRAPHVGSARNKARNNISNNSASGNARLNNEDTVNL